MSEARLSIIIVNYNGGDLLDRCLESIRDNPPAVPYEVILIDNASVDGSAERARASFPGLVHIDNTGNLGLSKAFNQGLEVARGDLILCLDNDTRALPGSLQALVDAADANPEVGAVGSKLLNPDMTPQKTARRFPSALNAVFGRRSFITSWWPGNPVSRRYLMEERLESDTDPYEVDWVSTAALLVTRKVIDEVGGLDEAFFVYWTDADWCARIRKGGYAIQCVPASKIIHDENLKGKRRTRRSTKMMIDFHRGAFIYYRRHRASSPYSPMALAALAGLSLRAATLIAWDYLRTLPATRK